MSGRRKGFTKGGCCRELHERLRGKLLPENVAEVHVRGQEKKFIESLTEHGAGLGHVLGLCQR